MSGGSQFSLSVANFNVFFFYYSYIILFEFFFLQFPGENGEVDLAARRDAADQTDDGGRQS